MRAGSGVPGPELQEFAALRLDALAIEIALGRVGQVLMDDQPLLGDVPSGDFRLVRLAELAAVVGAHELLRGQAVELEGRHRLRGIDEREQRRGEEAGGDACAAQQCDAPANAACGDHGARQQQREGEQAVVAQQRRAHGRHDEQRAAPPAVQERLRLLEQLEGQQREREKRRGKERVLGHRHGHDGEDRMQREQRRQREHRAPARAAPLHERAGIAERQRQQRHLQQAHQQHAERAAVQRLAQGDDAVHDRAVQQRMQVGVLARQVLVELADEVVVEHAGEVRQQQRHPADEQDERIAPQREARRAGCGRAVRRHQQAGNQRAQERRRHHRHGHAPHEAAEAAQQAVVDVQLGAEAQREREQTAQRERDAQRPAVGASQGGLRGKGGGAQQNQPQRSAAEHGAVRVFGDHVGRGGGAQQRKERGQRSGMLANEWHRCSFGRVSEDAGSKRPQTHGPARWERTGCV